MFIYGCYFALFSGYYFGFLILVNNSNRNRYLRIIGSKKIKNQIKNANNAFLFQVLVQYILFLIRNQSNFKSFLENITTQFAAFNLNKKKNNDIKKDLILNPNIFNETNEKKEKNSFLGTNYMYKGRIRYYSFLDYFFGVNLLSSLCIS